MYSTDCTVHNIQCLHPQQLLFHAYYARCTVQDTRSAHLRLLQHTLRCHRNRRSSSFSAHFSRNNRRFAKKMIILFEKRRAAFLLYFLLRLGNFPLPLYFIFILLLERERNHDYIRFIILCSPQDYVDSDGENV